MPVVKLGERFSTTAMVGDESVMGGQKQDDTWCYTIGTPCAEGITTVAINQISIQV